jgi:phosphoribosylformimino-5-aminoimidazole carboxamide ribotide isomerase
MDILPAIDLIDGKCVRLIQGQYDKQINYEDDPVKQAQLFRSEGARHLHIVDLDGAKAGEPVNTEAIGNIIAAVDLKVELGGGIRDEDSIKAMLDIGLDRLIIGTSAIRDFAWFSEMAAKYPHKLALGLDARGSKVSVSGWTQDSPQELWDFAAKAANLPLAAIVYTDITRDGMMTGPNFERTKALIDAVKIPVIAAGGVTETADIIKLKDLGAGGAIIGRAIYEGKITVAEAIAAEKQD